MFLMSVTFVEVLEWIGYVLVALLCLMFIIVVHEFGHYAAGKIFKFKINEFSIGFGPAIIKHTNKKTGEIFAIRCIPLGGYCAFDGEDEDGKETLTEGSFYSKPPWQRIIVLISGALFNFISSVIVIAIFFMAFGDVLPRIASAGEVFADKEMTVAAEQQFQEGDIIYSVDGEKVYSLIDANAFADAVGGKDEMSVVVIRDGEQVTLDIAKVYYADENAEGGSSYGFGISYGYTQYKLGFFPAMGHSFQFIGDVIKLIFTSIGRLFTGDAKISETLGGTVTAVSSLAQLTQFGFYAIMYGVCVLSASVAIMNILPFPALDGSKVVFTLIEWVRGKPINRKIENKIHFAGLMILFALAIVLDLVHFLG